MKRRITSILLASAVLLVATSPNPGVAQEALPAKSAKSCPKCHPEYEKQAALFAGQLVGVSQKAKTICLKMDGENEVVFYDDATVL
ncbi:MAG: hypothetical protein V2B18_20690, partial [Pseudomonadota bacterium]